MSSLVPGLLDGGGALHGALERWGLELPFLKLLQYGDGLKTGFGVRDTVVHPVLVCHQM